MKKAVFISLATVGLGLFSVLLNNNSMATGKYQQGNKQGKEIFSVAEQMPEFPGGDAALVNYLRKKINYPEEAQNNNEQGRVMVRFVVTAEGKVTEPKVVRGVSESLDQEALRVVTEMPVWKPGKQNGKPVNVYFTLPITFVAG